ncbi:MAG: hypothetical protein ACHQJD_02765 [Thermoanaerobaculia bacterium]
MSRRARVEPEDGMRAEYDFNRGVRGKYLERYKKGSVVVTLEPDVAEVFRDSASVNQALRLLANLARSQVQR